MYIYVASSWRNERYPEVVQALRDAGHDVYDFRETGFDFHLIGENWQSWTAEEMKAGLEHEMAIQHFEADVTAMKRADALVMVQPCGNSAHIELGYVASRSDAFTVVLLEERPRADLILKLADYMCSTIPELLDILARCEYPP